MWIDKGELVTYLKRGSLITGRVIRIMPGVPRAVVRSHHRERDEYLSEQVHFDEMRHATDAEKQEFTAEARRRLERKISA